MRRECPECQRLWREYAAATTSHVSLEKKLQGLKRGSPEAAALEKEVSTAAAVREATRRAIHLHEKNEHGKQAHTAEYSD